MPVQYAVFAGVVLSGLAYFFTAASQARLVELAPTKEGHYREQPVPARLPDKAITILQVYGSLFYASIDPLCEALPSAMGARHPVVILRLRQHDEIGSTFLTLIERYETQLKTAEGKLFLAGVSPHIKRQLDRTLITQDTITNENIFMATEIIHESLDAAILAAQGWLDSLHGG